MAETKEIGGVSVEDLKDELLDYLKENEEQDPSLKATRLEMERRFGTSFSEHKSVFKHLLTEVMEEMEASEGETESANEASENEMETTVDDSDETESANEASTDNDNTSVQNNKHSKGKKPNNRVIRPPRTLAQVEEQKFNKLLEDIKLKRQKQQEYLAISYGLSDSVQVTEQEKFRAELTANESSPWKEVEVTQALYLLPGEFRDLESSIVGFLNNRLMKFREELGGVLCGYSNVRKLGKKAPVGYSGKPMTPPFLYIPFMQFHISYKALLFVPTIGTQVLGEIKTMSSDHIGMVCYGLFNCSIRSHGFKSEFFEYDYQQHVWTHTETGAVLKQGMKIPFTVHHYDTRGLLHIFGDLWPGDWLNDLERQEQELNAAQQEPVDIVEDVERVETGNVPNGKQMMNEVENEDKGAIDTQQTENESIAVSETKSTEAKEKSKGDKKTKKKKDKDSKKSKKRKASELETADTEDIPKKKKKKKSTEKKKNKKSKSS